MAQKESDKPKRRVIKKAETSVREKAEISQKEASQPKKKGVLRLTGRFIGAPFRFIGRPFAKLGKFKVFRFIGRILLPTYFRNSWKELRQVTWPNRRESWQLTSAVIIFAVIFGVMIAVVDYGLDKVFKQVLLK
ncbi:MAG TPA: preprotein translocase subunit SecE [Patescibacteria group bacterium]|nr:preprotein translocase subunit SecE [Patescibacteria group bacterium]